MDKASRAIRRSGVKLMSLGGGHAALNVLLSDIKDVKSCAKAFMNAQHLAAQDMTRWAANQENRAVQDVVSNIAELFTVWTEVQKSFINSLKEYRQMYERILEGEKQVSQAKDNLDYCLEKEVKAKKEMSKVSKRASPGEMRILQTKVEQAESSKHLAELEVTERVRENEAVKLIRLKEGLLKMSGSYIELVTQGGTLFTAQRHIALQLPDVHGRDIDSIQYSGAGTTRFIIEKAKAKVQSFSINDISTDPPPPYTPPDPSSRSPTNSSSSVPSTRPGSVHHRHSMQYDTPDVRPSPTGNIRNRQSLPNSATLGPRSDHHRHSVPYNTLPTRTESSDNERTRDNRPRSRSDNCMSRYNQYPAGSGMPSSASSHSLPSYREIASNHDRAGGLSNYHPQHSEGSRPGESAISELTGAALVHTNIVKIQQVADSPEEITGSGNGLAGSSKNGYREPMEHTSHVSHLEDSMKYADDADQLTAISYSRPTPTPRRSRQNPDVSEGYQTAEED